MCAGDSCASLSLFMLHTADAGERRSGPSTLGSTPAVRAGLRSPSLALIRKSRGAGFAP